MRVGGGEVNANCRGGEAASEGCIFVSAAEGGRATETQCGREGEKKKVLRKRATQRHIVKTGQRQGIKIEMEQNSGRMKPTEEVWSTTLLLRTLSVCDG